MDYCRDICLLIYWEGGGRDQATLEKLIKRLEKWEVQIFCADYWNVYPKVKEKLKQGKSETPAIERNSCRQRHWLARFRRKSPVIVYILKMG